MKVKTSDEILKKDLISLTKFLLKKADCKHAGNCLAMCRVLRPHLSVFYNIDTFIMNTKVKQGRKKINHFYLLRNDNNMIIDATASQFKSPKGKQMPKIYMGEKPEFYL